MLNTFVVSYIKHHLIDIKLPHSYTYNSPLNALSSTVGSSASTFACRLPLVSMCGSNCVTELLVLFSVTDFIKNNAVTALTYYFSVTVLIYTSIKQ